MGRHNIRDLAFLASTVSAVAESTNDDMESYTDGVALDALNSGTGWNGAWVDGDADVASWIVRVQGQGSDVTGSGVVAAVTTFVTGLKIDGVWNKIQRMNIYVGDGLNACKAPLKNTIGNATDTLTNFVSGDFNIATGLTGDGSTKYVQTGFAANDSSIGDNDVHLAAYLRTAQNGTYNYAIGADIGTGLNCLSLIVDATIFWDANNVNAGRATANDATRLGFYIGSRTSSSSSVIYRNGSSLTPTVTPGAGGTRTSYTVYVHARNLTGSANGLISQTLEMYSIGTGLSSTDAANFTSRYSTLRTALGR